MTVRVIYGLYSDQRDSVRDEVEFRFKSDLIEAGTSSKFDTVEVRRLIRE